MRPILIYGAGRRTENYLKNNGSEHVFRIVDSDKGKSGKQLCGVLIISPDEVINWRDYYTVVNVKNSSEEILQYLREHGAVYREDFCKFEDLFQQPSNMDVMQRELAEQFLKNEEAGEICRLILSQNEYEQFRKEHEDCLEYERGLAKIYSQLPMKMGHYKGWCVVCKQIRDMEVYYDYSTGESPCWTETLRCCSCRCYCRTRMAYDYLEREKNKKIYINEQITVLYKELKKAIPDLVGSEFLDSESLGHIINGIRNEDATRLSFEKETFDVIASFDVYEHVDDYEQCFREANRCLKHGGKFVFSVPMNRGKYSHVKRAETDENGNIMYLKEPQYHGNPLSEKGALVFNEFGWKILDDLRSAGFAEAHAIVYFSAEKAYLGEFPMLFEAIKE